MREFVTAVEKSEQEGAEDESVEFKLDGRVLVALPPTEGQTAMLMLTMSKYMSDRDQAAGVIDFFISLLDDGSRDYIIDRLLSRKNPIPIESIIDILTMLVEEWSGRPFQLPLASTSSQPAGGRRSSPATTKSTSSRSRRTGS